MVQTTVLVMLAFVLGDNARGGGGGGFCALGVTVMRGRSDMGGDRRGG